MKTININELIKLIKSLEIEDIHIIREINTLDISNPENKEYLIQSTGYYEIRIKGQQAKLK